jgi:hypothetical protein
MGAFANVILSAVAFAVPACAQAKTPRAPPQAPKIPHSVGFFSGTTATKLRQSRVQPLRVRKMLSARFLRVINSGVPMPSPETILSLAATTANEYRTLAIGWHVLFGVLLLALLSLTLMGLASRLSKERVTLDYGLRIGAALLGVVRARGSLNPSLGPKVLAEAQAWRQYLGL